MNNNEDLLPLKFTNRERELKTICAPGKPLMLIDAPSGYGKTYVLEEVERRLEAEWTCVHVRLEKCRSKSAIRQAIIDALIENKKILPEEMRQLSTSDDRDADNRLMRVLGKAGNVILMCDAIERAEGGDREWLLGGFMPACVKNIPGTGFRVIVTGRYAGVTFPAILRGYESIFLAQFTQAIVEEVLINALEMCPPPPTLEITDEHLKRWSRHVIRLSGGHPRSIQKLVTDLAKEKCWIINFPDEEVNLFNKHIAPEINAIIAELDEPMRQALEIVSIFRVFTYNVVDALQNAELPEGVVFPQNNSRLVVNKLINCGLFIKKNKNNPFFSDETVRNLILARRRILSPAIYQGLNQLAQRIYDHWIEELIKESEQLQTGPTSSLDFLETCVTESIYHFCQSFRNGDSVTQSQMADCLKKHSEYLVKGLKWDEHDPHYRTKLENMVMGDNEIRETLEAHRLDFQVLWKIAFESIVPTKPAVENNGENIMPLEIKYTSGRTVGNWLIDTLDVLRHNLINVLVERWEKRNKGRGITPPQFDDQDQMRQKFNELYPSDEALEKKLHAYKFNDSYVVVNESHLKHLREQIQQAQETIDRYKVALERPLPEKERIQLTSDIDERQASLNKAVEEFADIYAYLYS